MYPSTGCELWLSVVPPPPPSSSTSALLLPLSTDDHNPRSFLENLLESRWLGAAGGSCEWHTYHCLHSRHRVHFLPPHQSAMCHLCCTLYRSVSLSEWLSAQAALLMGVPLYFHTYFTTKLLISIVKGVNWYRTEFRDQLEERWHFKKTGLSDAEFSLYFPFPWFL